MGAIGPELGKQRGVIVEKAKAVIGQLVQSCLQPFDRLDILLVVAPVSLDRIGQTRVAEDHGNIRKQRGPARQAAHPARRFAGHEQPMCDHAEILIAMRVRRRQRMKPEIGKGRAREQRLEAVFRIQALAIELVGDNATLGVDDDLPADQPVAITRKLALAADEMVLVDPFP